MRPLLARAAALLIVGIVAAAPSGARAWTDATVRTVSAHLVIAPDGRTEVDLVAQLRVDGGWLEAFELDGLDPDLELIPERPATFTEASGRALAPRIEQPGEGRVTFAFRRRMAPRRGEYVARLAYRTSLAHRATEVDDQGRVVLRWTLPSWRYGLDDVEITVDAPHGAQVVPDERDDGTVELERTESAAGARLVFRRVHMPRTREWPIVIVVPAEAMDAALRSPIAGPPRVLPAPAEGDDAPVPGGIAWIALILALLAIAKNAAVALGERASRVSSSAVVPLGAVPRSVLACAAAGAAVLLGDRPELALGALAIVATLALHRRSSAPRAPRLGSFRPTRAADHARARSALRRERIGPGAWVDPSTVPGASVLAAIAAAPALAWAHGALPVPFPVALLASALGGAILLGGGRRSRPSRPLVDLAHLLEHATCVRAVLAPDVGRAWTLRPVLHADVRGEPQDARLRVMLPSTPKGLLRLDVVRAARAERGSWRSELHLLIVARDGSPADRALDERFADARIAEAPRRVARLLPIDRDLARTLAPVLDALATCPVDTRSDTEPDVRRAPEPSLAATA